MSVKVRVLGALQTVTSAKVKTGGTVRTLRTIKVMDGGALRTVATFAAPLSLSISPSTVTGTHYSTSPAATTITTASATAAPSGGQGPYTYAWTFVSKTEGDTPTATKPAFATSAFKQTNVPAVADRSAVFRCTVTDSFGDTATATVTAQFISEVEAVEP